MLGGSRVQHIEGTCAAQIDISALVVQLDKELKRTRKSWCVSTRLSLSTSKVLARKSRKIGDSFSGSLIFGVPFVAMRNNALSGFSFCNCYPQYQSLLSRGAKKSSVPGKVALPPPSQWP